MFNASSFIRTMISTRRFLVAENQKINSVLITEEKKRRIKN